MRPQDNKNGIENSAIIAGLEKRVERASLSTTSVPGVKAAGTLFGLMQGNGEPLSIR